MSRDTTPQRVRKLAADECARYYRILNGGWKNYCLARADRCVFFTAGEGEMVRCAYFEKCVLPLDPELQAVYFGERVPLLEIKRSGVAKPKPQARVKCAKCGQIFLAASSRQKLCEKCGKQAQKDQHREWTRQQKQKRSSDLPLTVSTPLQTAL